MSREAQMLSLLLEGREPPAGAVASMVMPDDGRLASVLPELFGSARLVVSDFRPRCPTDERSFYDRWRRYPSVGEAVAAMLAGDLP